MQTEQFRIGTRGSALALAQAYETRARLMAAHGLPEAAFSIESISTAGGSSGTSAEYAEAFNAWGELLAQARRVPVNAQ